MPDKKLADAYASYLSGRSRKELFGEIVATLHRQHDEIEALKVKAEKTDGMVALHDAATGLADALRNAMPKGRMLTVEEMQADNAAATKRKLGRPPKAEVTS